MYSCQCVDGLEHIAHMHVSVVSTEPHTYTHTYTHTHAHTHTHNTIYDVMLIARWNIYHACCENIFFFCWNCCVHQLFASGMYQ